jgi:tyrosine-protein kinase Etk/Wzc
MMPVYEKGTKPQHTRDDRAEAGDIDLLELLHYLFIHKWSIFLVTLLVFSVTAAYAFLATPVYRADALLQVEETKLVIPGLDDLSNMLGEEPQGQSELVVIESRRILGAAVDKLHLNYQVEPVYLPVIGKGIARYHDGDELAEPFLGLRTYAWGGEEIVLDRFEIEGKLNDKTSSWTILVGESDAYTLLASDGETVLKGRVGELATGTFRKSSFNVYISRLKARAGTSFMVKFASRISTLNRLKEMVNVSEAGKETGLIHLTLEGDDPVAIVEILDEITHYYVRSNVEQHSKEAENILQFVDSQLPALKEQLDAAESALQGYQQASGTVDLQFETQSTVTKLVELEKQISELKLEETELAQRFTERHPTLQVIKKQIGQFEDEKRQIEEKLNALPEREWEFIQKTRDVKVASELYVTLLNKGQELKVAKAGTVGNVRILDNAQANDKPIKPRKALILAMGLMLGLMLGIGVILLKRALHRGVQDPDLIERETSLSVYSTIPHSDAEEKLSSILTRRARHHKRKPQLLALLHKDDMAVEALRSFRTSMRFLLKTAENNVIILSGPSPGVGKSFVSANYAVVAASDDARVLVIDADMRKGHLYNAMGTRKAPGLSEWIAGDTSIDEVAREIDDNLFFIPCGKKPPNPAELLASDSFQSLLKDTREKFDLVIIDTPPILAVTDASIIAQYGGQVFVLIRSGQHRMNEIKAAISRFEKDGVKVAGILMNDAPLMEGYYSNKYAYTYHYQYR